MFHSKILKNNSGFTLVELMVAVGITGALTSIAVPNYLKYVAKSRESEAKIALSAIYVGEKQFGVEYGYYNACLSKVGYQVPPASAANYYTVGFKNTQASLPVCGSGGGTACYNIPNASCTAAGVGNTVYAATVKSGSALPGEGDLTLPSGNLTGVGTTKFSVGAVGSISSGSNYDKWQIDQDKKISNVQSGI